jgi:hypothetical protein
MEKANTTDGIILGNSHAALRNVPVVSLIEVDSSARKSPIPTLNARVPETKIAVFVKIVTVNGSLIILMKFSKPTKFQLNL